MLTDSNVLAKVPCRVYLDLDPAFTQLWHHVEGIDMRFDHHTHFVTVGLNIGGQSDVPTCGRNGRQRCRPWSSTNGFLRTGSLTRRSPLSPIGGATARSSTQA
jgi:hypothetical protein